MNIIRLENRDVVLAMRLNGYLGRSSYGYPRNYEYYEDLFFGPGPVTSDGESQGPGSPAASVEDGSDDEPPSSALGADLSLSPVAEPVEVSPVSPVAEPVEVSPVAPLVPLLDLMRAEVAERERERELERERASVVVPLEEIEADEYDFLFVPRLKRLRRQRRSTDN